MEVVTDFLFLGSKITADGDCSHEIRRRLLLGRKVMTNLDSVSKSRDITLPTKVHIVKATVFPVVTYGCESWIIKKAEHQRIWCLQTEVLEKSLESPLDSKEIKPVILKRNQPEYSLEGLMVKLQYFGNLMQTRWLIGKDADAGKDWRQKEKRVSEDEMAGWHHWLNDMNLGKFQEIMRDREVWHATVHGIAKSQKQMGNWTMGDWIYSVTQQ